MKKFGLLALAGVAALVFGVASFGTKTADAKVTGSAAVWCGYFGALETPVNACDGLTDAEIVTVANEVGDKDGKLEPGELDDIDLDANQVTEGAGYPYDSLILFAFVDNDGTVTFDAESGVTIDVQVNGASSADGDANLETCAAGDDLDCDTATLDDGDGVATAIVSLGTATQGDSVDVDISQADDTSEVSTETVDVVGTPDEIAVTAFEDTIQATGSTSAFNDCIDEADVTDSSQLNDVEKTFVVAVVTDSDGTKLTRAAVDWTVDDDNIGDIADDTAVSVDAGTAGIGDFAVICGGTDTGTLTVNGALDDSFADAEDQDVQIEVVGEPANVALTANPAAIDCNGTATSTVTATVTDSDGNNVANGTNVNFSVVALGTASPINVDTADGKASSTITPLSGAVAGVTVIVSAGDAQASLRIDCNTPAAATATPGGPAATPTRPGGTIGPPNTGTGGYLGQDSSAGFPLWTLVALSLGAVALVGGGAIARRAAK